MATSYLLLLESSDSSESEVKNQNLLRHEGMLIDNASFSVRIHFFPPTAEGLCSSNGLRFYFLLPRARSYRNYPAMA